MNLPSATKVDKTARLGIVAVAWAFLSLVIVLAAAFAWSVNVDNPGDATREVLFNVGHWLRWLLYGGTAIVFLVIAYGPVRRSQLWRIGKSEERWDRIVDRAKVFLFYGIGQGRMP